VDFALGLNGASALGCPFSCSSFLAEKVLVLLLSFPEGKKAHHSPSPGRPRAQFICLGRFGTNVRSLPCFYFFQKPKFVILGGMSARKGRIPISPALT
jgi:hypothetical protein